MTLTLRKALSLVLLALFLGGGSASMVATVKKAEVVPATTDIPRGNYKTWSLFLVCNPRWLASDKTHELYDLYSQFESFGDSIGPDNLAVWFWKRKVSVKSDLAANVDVTR